MKHAWQIWTAFGVCLAVAATAIGWLTVKTVSLDRAETQSRRLAAREEQIRLALWRMDSAIAPLIAQESVRRPFLDDPPGGWGTVEPHAHWSLADGTVPAVARFRIDSQGGRSSVRGKASAAHIGWTNRPGFQELLAQLPPPPVELAESTTSLADVAEQSLDLGDRPFPIDGNDFQARSAIVVQNSIASQNGGLLLHRALPNPNQPPSRPAIVSPLWNDGKLLLARRVLSEGCEHVEGCVLDWPAIESELTGLIEDLLPDASLHPVPSPADADESRMLAALPVRLDPGPPLGSPAGIASSLHISLWLAWGSLVLAAIAAGVLLKGVLGLSERRAAFASAVTHELRTPLTTFRMYAEMLAEGMVPDESARRHYLHTLQTEADRLMHLVENVLAYSRLERGPSTTRIRLVTVEGLCAATTDRLVQRAEASGFILAVELPDALRFLSVRADVSLVEQILFNLVDNACKYAAEAADRRLHLRAATTGRRLELLVQDHGPGIPRRDRRRLFRPFHKSADDAARSAPGVGLGLALSRRLARQMKGNLRLASGEPDGAAFVLELPLVEPEPNSSPDSR